MRLARFIISILVSLLVATFSFAQTGPATSVSGKLTDSKNVPVSYATVTLLRGDSSVVSGDLTKDDGTFTITPAGIGNFRLRIEALGYAQKIVTVEITAAAPEKNVGIIKLMQTENSLNEVSVVGEKAVMELKVDKKVFNVEKNTTTAGGSATDVLQNVPAVSVDADGTVSLRGKTGVTILIDGKPATLLGSDVASALQSLPAGSIESVEVITNPSAKYDAQGTSGIINIVLKKDGRLGMNGSATLGAGTRDKYNGNLSLNVRKGKWNVFLNSSFRLNSTYNNVTTDRVDKIPADSPATMLQRSYHTYEHVPRNFDGTFNTIGATFDPDKYNSFTLTENINIMKFSFRDRSEYNIYENPTQTAPSSYQQQRYSSFSGQPTSLSTSLDYKHKFKKKDEELTMNATFAATAFKRTQDFNTTDNAGTIVQSAPGTGDNNTLNVQADYTDPLFTKNGKFGAGFKSQLYWFTSDAVPSKSVNGAPPVTDLTLLSVFNYTQQVHAGYVNWNDQIGKFGYQLGLRTEYAVYDGTGKTPRDTSLHNEFLSLFPTLFFSYQLANQQSIYLNFSRRTNRPGFMQLLPFIDISNPGTVNTGNPALIPEFIHNIEFSYSKADNRGDNFIFSAYYAYTKNLIERATTTVTPQQAESYNVSSSSLFTQPVNIESGTTYGLEGTGHIQIIPIWDATLNANFFQNQLVIGDRYPQLAQNLANRNGFTWFGKVNTSVKLPKNFSLQVNVNYESPKVIAQGSLKETYWVDVALRKNLWKNKATLVLNCSDVFKTHIFVTNYDQNVFYQTINRVKETRIGNITFTYRFGKIDKGGGMSSGKRGKISEEKKPPRPSEEDRGKNMKESDEGGGEQGGGQGGGGRRQGQ